MGTTIHADMAAQRHPIDQEIRDRLRRWFEQADTGTQAEFAKQIGANPAWLNKYVNGSGHATVDDVIRMVAVYLGVSSLTATERRMLRAFRRSGWDEDAVNVVERLPRRVTPPQPPPESTARTSRARRETKHRERGTP